jgi:hypothetical protein
MVRVAQPGGVVYSRVEAMVARCEHISPESATNQAMWERVRSARAGKVRQGQAPRSLQPVMLMR